MVKVLALLMLLGGSQPPAFDPLETTPEMRRWIDQQGPWAESPAARWQQLGERLNQRLPFTETPLITYTAADAFRRGEGNCVSFALLTVALARDAGLDAYFVLVDADDATLQRGDLRINQQHLAAGFAQGRRASLVDLGGWRPAGPRDHPVPDRTAAAIFFSNRGVERLLGGFADEASAWLRLAADLDPGLATTWVNLGVAERRAGRPRRAVRAYRQALDLNPDLPAARGNLGLLEQQWKE